MINRGEIKSFVRFRKRLQNLTYEAKAARTFADDVDVRHGATALRCRHVRPGQRDDEMSCGFSALLTTY